MSTEEKDYLLRMIALAAAALRRLRERLAGHAGSPADVVRDAGAAQGELLGSDATLLAALDPVSLARILAHRDRVALYADLLEVEAEAHRRLNDLERAKGLSRRAAALRASLDTGSPAVQ